MTAFPPAKHDALGLDGLLGPQEREVRDRVRQFAVSCLARLHGALASRPNAGCCCCCCTSAVRCTGPCHITSMPSRRGPLPQEREIAPVIAGYWERAEFPFPLVPGFQVRPQGRLRGMGRYRASPCSRSGLRCAMLLPAPHRHLGAPRPHAALACRSWALAAAP